jgi:hypothetical protein
LALTAAPDARRVVRIAGGAASRAPVARRELAHVCLGEDDGASLAQAGNDFSVLFRPVVCILGHSAVGGAHVTRIVLILDRERDAVQWAGKFSRPRKFPIKLLCGFERVGQGRIAVDGICCRPSAPDIQSHQCIDLAGIRDRRDIAELQPGGRVAGTCHALAVVGIDALEVKINQLGCG